MKLNSVSGQPFDSYNMCTSLDNLLEVKGKFFGSGFNIKVETLKGTGVANIQIGGENFDPAIDILIDAIVTSLTLKRALVVNELKRIEGAIEIASKK